MPNLLTRVGEALTSDKLDPEKVFVGPHNPDPETRKHYSVKDKDLDADLEKAGLKVWIPKGRSR